MSRPSAVVIGAGVGGLTAALALRHAGFEARVYERATDFAHIQRGGGLHIWPNAMRALRQIEADGPVAAAGEPIDFVYFRNSKGRSITQLDVGEIARDVGSIAVNVSRASLHRALLDQLGEDAVALGAECSGFTDDGEQVTVTFADGQQARADVLIGADGLQSRVRALVLGAEPPEYSGYMAWTAVVDLDDARATNNALVLSFGPGTRFIYCQVGRSRYAWVASANASEDAMDPPGGRRQAVAETFAEYPARSPS